jgi:hypothetical protein
MSRVGRPPIRVCALTTGRGPSAIATPGRCAIRSASAATVVTAVTWGPFVARMSRS